MVFKHTIPARLLRQVESENPDERLTALKEIMRRRIRRSDVEPIILKLLKDEDERVRVEALGALVTFLGEEAISPYLLDALRDKSPEVRLAAVKHLKFLKYRSIHDRIEPLLHDSELRVRLEALRAIVTLRDLAAVDTLVDVLISADDDTALIKEALNQLNSLVKHDPRYFILYWSEHLNQMESLLQKPQIFEEFLQSLQSELITAARSLLQDRSLAIQAIKDQLELFLPNRVFTRKLKELVEVYMEEQREYLRKYGIHVRPSIIEGFPGSEERVIIEGPGLIFREVLVEPEGIIAMSDEQQQLPSENVLTLTCKIVEKSLQPTDHDVMLQITVEKLDKGVLGLSIKLPVKNHGLIGLDQEARRVLFYLKDHPKPSLESLLMTLEIPSLLIPPIMTYLNMDVPLRLDDLVPKDYVFLDEIARRLLQAKPKSNDFSLFDLQEIVDEQFVVTIAEFKQALQFLQFFSDVSQRDRVDVLAEGSAHLVDLSRLAMQLYEFTERGKKKKSIDSACRALNVGPWQLLRTWKYFDDLRNERITFEEELHRTIDPVVVQELNDLSRQFIKLSVEQLTLDQWLDYWRYMFFLSRWRSIPLDWFAPHVNDSLLDEVDQVAIPLSRILLDSGKMSFVELYQRLVGDGLSASPLAVAFFLKLVHETIDWTPEFILFVRDVLLPKMEMDPRAFDDAMLSMAAVIDDPRNAPLLSTIVALNMNVVDGIVVKFWHDELIASAPKDLPSPPSDVLNQVMKWIMEEDSDSLWRLLKKWAALKKDGASIPRDVVRLTVSAMHVFHEQYTIHQVDLTQLSMQERLSLNQQAIKLLKVLKENARPLTPVELAELSGLPPSKVIQVLSYAHSTPELRSLLEKQLTHVQVTRTTTFQQNRTATITFVSDVKATIVESKKPSLNRIELKSGKIKIKPVRFSFDWL